ncbi:MAG: cupin domain-containing protein [Mariniblastus sp.]|nr:cupin domain-containing protein [Mariniblastus sp.]
MKIVRGNSLEFVPASHEDSRNPGVLKKVLATRNDLIAGRVQMVNWSHLPAGSQFQSHYHEDMQEVFVILNGQVAMTVNGRQVELQGGDAILIDAREIHQMKNCCEQDVDYVVFGISREQGGQTVLALPSQESGE